MSRESHEIARAKRQSQGGELRGLGTREPKFDAGSLQAEKNRLNVQQQAQAVPRLFALSLLVVSLSDSTAKKRKRRFRRFLIFGSITRFFGLLASTHHRSEWSLSFPTFGPIPGNRAHTVGIFRLRTGASTQAGNTGRKKDKSNDATHRLSEEAQEPEPWRPERAKLLLQPSPCRRRCRSLRRRAARKRP